MAALALILLLATPAPVAQEPSLADLVRDLGDGRDHAKRNAAYNLLRQRRDPRAIPLLLKALPGYGTHGQSQGVYLLQAFPAEIGHPALQRLARTGPPFLSLCCAVNLYRRGRREFAREICAALQAPGVEETVRTQMLGRIHGVDEAGVKAQARALIVPQRSANLLGAAFYYLHSVRDREAGEAARRLIGSADVKPGIQAMAAAFLVSLGDDEHVPLLAEALRAAQVRPLEFSRMQMFLTAAPHLDERILKAVVESLEGQENHTALMSAISLIERFQYHAGVPALRRLLDHEDGRVARRALAALAGIPGALQKSVIQRLLGSEDSESRLHAAELLRRLDDHTGLPAVLEIIRSGDPKKVEALRVLGGFRVPEVVPILLDALLDADRAARIRALNSLQAVLTALHPYRSIDLRSTGYEPDATPALRLEGIQRIRTWWAARREG